MNAGIYKGLPEADHHAIDAIGSSPLKRFHDCPQTAFDPIEQSEDMLLGSAQDCYSLYGSAEFHERFTVLPDFGDLRKPENRGKKADFEAACIGKKTLPATVTTKKIPTMKAIVDVDNMLFKEHPFSRLVLRAGGQNQVSIVWHDEATGLKCKGRYDFLPDSQYRTIFDLKKCGRIEYFNRQMEDLKYYLQAGHYVVGAKTHGLDVDAFGFIAFNFGTPPTVRVIFMDPDYLSLSERLAKNTVSLISECRQAGVFPSYSIPIETVSMAAMLGLKSDIPNQLTPQGLAETAYAPRSLNAL